MFLSSRKRFEVKDRRTSRGCGCRGGQPVHPWVNGAGGGAGPAHFDPLHQVYDTLDLSGFVTPGENVCRGGVMLLGPGDQPHPVIPVQREAGVFCSTVRR